MQFLEPGYLVKIVCYDGEKQVTRVAEVTGYDQGLLTVAEPDGRTTVYNLRSFGLLSASEVVPDDEVVRNWPRGGR